MDLPYPIDVLGSGAVLLGDTVVCDGFQRDRPIRIQTHIHDDHMRAFSDSKGYQDILMSSATRDLLVADLNADIGVRENIRALSFGDCRVSNGVTIRLFASGHILGAVQVEVVLTNGDRLGYSGDFGWPLEDVIQVDALVVDSTYGSPDSVRGFTQEEAESALIDVIRDRIDSGTVYIKAHRGTVQQAIQLIATELELPIVASEKLCREIEVYKGHGYPIGDVLCREIANSKAIGDRCIQLYSKGDRLPEDYRGGSSVILSAFGLCGDSPVLKFTDTSYRIAMSSHADFNGTLEYVAATGAQYVVVDNYRGGHGVELAQAIEERLKIRAAPSTNQTSREWGA